MEKNPENIVVYGLYLMKSTRKKKNKAHFQVLESLKNVIVFEFSKEI